MAKTFRQEVEEILCKDCKKDSLVVVAFDCPKCATRKQLDRICSAAKRMGERMPMTAVSARCQREADQYYIAKETEGGLSDEG